MKSSKTSLTRHQKEVWCLDGEKRQETRCRVSSVGRMLCNGRPLWLIIISLHTPITSTALETKTSGPLNTGKG